MLFSSTKRSNICLLVFCFFPEIWEKSVGKNISKSLRSKYSQNLFDHVKQSATDILKTASKKQFKK